MAIWGPLIAAGASLAGGLLNKSSAEDAKDAAAANFGQQLKFQEDLAQFGIRWRVEDAQAAGIHPLAALGANLVSPSPIGVTFPADQSMGNALADAGQGIGRAVEAGLTEPERVSRHVRTMQALQEQKTRAEISLLYAETMRNQRAANPPIPTQSASMILPGQGNSGPSSSADAFLTGLKPSGSNQPIVENPLERTVTRPGYPHQEPGAIPEIGWSRTATGYAPIPSKDIKDRIEDMIIPELTWAGRNMISPLFGVLDPPFEAPPGYEWKFAPWLFEYQLKELPSDYVPPTPEWLAPPSEIIRQYNRGRR